MSDKNKVIVTTTQDVAKVTATPTTTRVSTSDQTSGTAGNVGVKNVSVTQANDRVLASGVGTAGKAGIVWKGAWNGNINYDAGDAVSFDGRAYITQNGFIANNTNPADDATNWMILSDRGEKGDTGAASTEPGPRGMPGKGIKGDTGATGAKGEKGRTGEKGNDGSQGATGPRGEKGERGEKGADSTVEGPEGRRGAEGQRGRTGSTGLPGEDGRDGADSTVEGPPGAQGVKGDRGKKGADSFIAGPEGRQGNDGLDGDRGKRGPVGATGADSTEPGPTGRPGDRGPSGQRGLQGFKGSEGPMGVEGPEGPKGKSDTWRSGYLDPLFAFPDAEIGDFYFETDRLIFWEFKVDTPQTPPAGGWVEIADANPLVAHEIATDINTLGVTSLVAIEIAGKKLYANFQEAAYPDFAINLSGAPDSSSVYSLQSDFTLVVNTSTGTLTTINSINTSEEIGVISNNTAIFSGVNYLAEGDYTGSASATGESEHPTSLTQTVNASVGWNRFVPTYWVAASSVPTELPSVDTGVSSFGSRTIPGSVGQEVFLITTRSGFRFNELGFEVFEQQVGTITNQVDVYGTSRDFKVYNMGIIGSSNQMVLNLVNGGV